MKKLITALLLSGPLTAMAMTENPDGSVTLTAEESRVILQNINGLLAEQERMAAIITELMRHIETTNTQEQTSGGGSDNLQCI